MSGTLQKLSLLPSSAIGFSSEIYWDAFFTKRKEGFDWYGEYEELSPFLKKCVTKTDDILVVGCGNSTLSSELYAAGFCNQVNIDISHVVVNQMSKEYPSMIFEHGDVTQLNCPDERYSCVLDKGTFDALTPLPRRESAKETDSEGKEQILSDFVKQEQKAHKMLCEVSRVLKIRGRFVCISLLQEHVAEILITYFYDLGWMIRVSRCVAAEKASQGGSSGAIFPVYVCVFTKILKIPGTNVTVIEFFGHNGKGSRMSSATELLMAVKDEMLVSFYSQAVKRLGYAAETPLCFELTDETGKLKYILHVVDVAALAKNPIQKQFGVFITPQGRESEYIYGTHEGRTSLAMQAGFARLAVFHLLRDRVYPSLDEVQKEIRANLNFITPTEVLARIDEAKPPIMTEEAKLGSREIIYRGNSEFSGDYVVEDVQIKPDIIRRLIFLNAPNVIQSEVFIKVEKKGKGKSSKDFKKTPLSTILTCDHHGIMSLSVSMLRYLLKVDETKTLDILVIGLGGGLLVSFLHKFFPTLRITAVELDKEIVEVGKQYFGLPVSEDERLRIVVDDGLNFIKNNYTKFEVIMIDVDNKSVAEGLSCPPPEFLTPETLEAMKAALSSQGIFVLNFVCRNRELEKKYKNFLSSHFPFIYYYDLKEDVNTVFFCFMRTPPGNSKRFFGSLCKSVRHLRDVHFLQKPYEGEAPWTSNGKGEKGNTKNHSTNGNGKDGCALDFTFTQDSIAAIGSDDNLENMCLQFKILRV